MLMTQCKKEAMNLEDSEEGYIGVFGGRTGKGALI